MNASPNTLGPGCGPAAADLPEMVDVAFGLAGDSLPGGFEWPLFREIARILPWIAKSRRAGILPLRGPRTADGGLMITHRSRIVIRLPRDRVCSASALERAALRVGDSVLIVGEGTFRKHQPAPTLYSPRVATGEADEARFVAGLDEETLGPRRARPPHLRAARRGRPRGGARHARTRWRCTTCARTTRSCCSAPGWGAGQPVGCGLLVPHKTIVAAD